MQSQRRKNWKNWVFRNMLSRDVSSMIKVTVKPHRMRFSKKFVSADQGNSLVVDLNINATVQELFDYLCIDTRGKLVIVNDKAVSDLHAELNDGDHVDIHRLVAGG